ncbi:MAG: NADH-quinone oxidoreductase subunit J [Magnetococcales bacterium]|nr:NADH-quinone oxidoreductase subunit J [Magnetococcales bacterium]
MMVADLVFYFFSAIVVGAALGVIVSRNQVHSVLFLILAFFNTAGLFVLLQAEFLAALLVIVYMGAVAVLFLFVVMMLDVDYEELRKGFMQHLPMGLFVGALILVEFAFILGGIHVDGQALAPAAGISNTQAIGQLLYTRYLLPFEIASLILLVALIGAVVLTLRKRTGVKRQNIPAQIARKREEAVEMVKVASGQGANKP